MLLLITSCSVDRSNWTGIWQTKIEYITGIQSTFELELSKGMFNSEWSGRWEAAEIMQYGVIPKLKVTNFNIEFDFVDVGKFEGKLLQENILEGIVYGLDGKKDTLRFIKVDDWTSNMPARVNENGLAINNWNYSSPELMDDGWPIVDLRNSNVFQQPLNRLFQNVVDGKYQGLDAALISYNGELILEEYFHLGAQNRIHLINSCTKSVTSLLIGIAHDNELISNINLPIRDYFNNYTDTLNPSNWPVSLKHALTMSAGLTWQENNIPYSNPKNDAIRINFSSDMYRYVLSRKIAKGGQPGEKFEYNSGLSILLGGVLLNSTKMPTDKYAEQSLFMNLGIQQYFWQSVNNQVHTGGGLLLLPRDFLKIGQLVLNNGKWNGQQVVSESWIKESTSFHLPISESKDEGYGYQWWTGHLNVDQTKIPIVYAAGYGGQFLYIVPDLNLVALFLHHNPSDFNLNHTIAFSEMEKFIAPAFLLK
ncbi:serine hydrolase domain-containing protein [Portibacter lacus]|nr:serine hydrolase [Portibacter lacus]